MYFAMYFFPLKPHGWDGKEGWGGEVFKLEDKLRFSPESCHFNFYV